MTSYSHLQLKSVDESLLHQPLCLPQPDDSTLLSTSTFQDLSKQRIQFFSASQWKNLVSGRQQRSYPCVVSSQSPTREKDPTTRTSGKISEEALQPALGRVGETEKSMQMLKEQMAILTHHKGSSSLIGTKRAQKVTTQHRRRKKVNEVQNEEETMDEGVVIVSRSLRTNPYPNTSTMAYLLPH
ncbi:unnamed protein product [Peronospora belbahrii]|uniref:Uncharacterized protein n=1 Tax=Peronospora belbahrii TaxID=622444 RepID=A0ABN8D755_9STRA|nr:unnamed protein product [Peronospora belbahrii]